MCLGAIKCAMGVTDAGTEITLHLRPEPILNEYIQPSQFLSRCGMPGDHEHGK
jgi:hypothetical protein